MKKIAIIISLLCATLVVSAQEVPTSFPRKFLLEHFTGEGCGYCPGGMYAMVKHIESSNIPHIWVSHHSNTDEYTIPENARIGKAVGVQGAPNLAFNRTKLMGQFIAFNPVNLPNLADLIVRKFDTVAEASVLIDRTYNPDTRELTVTVSGQVANAETTEYLLTVLVKENGLLGKQSDYGSYSYGGWKEFIHPRVVRDVLSAEALGDTVYVTNQAYSKTYSYTISEDWVPENCGVVAYITPLEKKPIINAEETPLVEGTTGGEHYKWPFGVTEMGTPTTGKMTFKNLEVSKPSADKLELRMVSDKSYTSNYGPTKLVATLEFNTPDSVLPMDTLFMFADSDSLHTFSVGQFDLATQTFSGSRIQYHLAKDMDFITNSWRIKSGKMKIDGNGGFTVSGKLYMGSNFNIVCTMPAPTPVENVVFDKAHVEKLMRDGKIVISIDGVEYDVQGRVIQ